MDDVVDKGRMVGVGSTGAKREDLFSKDGIGSHKTGGQLRLLVHCEGCPPFLTVVAHETTVGDLKDQVQRHHEELFRSGGVGDVPAVKIRWLEDSHRHALPLQSQVGALLADREKVYAVSRFVQDPYGEASSGWGGGPPRRVSEIVGGWRSACERVAEELCAMARSDEMREELLQEGGLQVLLCVALHAGTMVPGDVSLAKVHEGLRELLKGDMSGREIVESGCEGQAVALLQAPDPDLQALGAFLCARMSADRRSHAAVLSWGGCLRLAKAMSLSSSPSLRFDAATSLRLLSENPSSHGHLCDDPVLRAIKEAVQDSSDPPCQGKCAGAALAMVRCGSARVLEMLRGAGMEGALEVCSERGGDAHARRVAGEACGALRGGGGVSSLSNLPPVDEDLGMRKSLKTPEVQGQRVRIADGGGGGGGGEGQQRRGRVDTDEDSGRGEAGRGEGWVERMRKLVEGGSNVESELIRGIEGGRGGELLSKGQGMRLLSMIAQNRPGSAAAALALLCKGGESWRSAVVAEGGVPLAITLARSFDPAVQVQGFDVLATLSHHRHLHTRLVQFGVVGVLLASIKSTDETIRMRCAKALSHLSSLEQVRSEIIQDKGMARMLASIKGSPPSDPFTAYIKLIARE